MKKNKEKDKKVFHKSFGFVSKEDFEKLQKLGIGPEYEALKKKIFNGKK